MLSAARAQKESAANRLIGELFENVAGLKAAQKIEMLTTTSLLPQSEATLQAALDAMGNKDPSIGYSIAYPFGVIGPILCIYFMTRMVQPKFPAKVQDLEAELARVEAALESWNAPC